MDDAWRAAQKKQCVASPDASGARQGPHVAAIEAAQSLYNPRT